MWDELGLVCVELTTVMRLEASQRKLIEILKEVRLGRLSEESAAELQNAAGHEIEGAAPLHRLTVTHTTHRQDVPQSS